MKSFLCLLALLGFSVMVPAQGLHTIPLRRSRDVRQYLGLLRKLHVSRLDVDYKEQSLADVIGDLRRRLGLALLIARPLKERAHAEVVSLSLHALRALSLMKILSEEHAFVFQNRHGIIFATTPEDATQHAMVLQIYSVRDMLYVPPDFPGPKLGLRVGPPGEEDGGEAEESTREGKDPELLRDLIEKATGAAHWEVDGAVLRIAHGLLIVRQTPEVQRKVRHFVNSLRGVF